MKLGVETAERLQKAAEDLLEHDVESGSQGPVFEEEKLKQFELEESARWESTEKKQSCKQGLSGNHNSGAAQAAGALTLLRKFPGYLLLAPSILFCLVVALSAFGIVYSTDATFKTEGRQARDAAVSAADGVAKQLSSASKAALTLATIVQMNPNWSFLEDNFFRLGKELFRQSREEGNLNIMEVALAPFGRIRLDYAEPILRNQTRDLFGPPYVGILGTFRSVEERGLSITGPIPITDLDGQESFAFSARYPVYIPDTDADESWGHPDNITHPTNCSGPPCFIPETREKFWGFTGGLVDAEPILKGNSVHLERLLADDLSYSLTTSFLVGANGPGVVVSGGPHPEKATANITVNLPGSSWVLSVYNPRQEEVIQTRKGLLVMVVIAALILSVLLLLLLLSAKRASVLLHEQVVTNKALEDEKVSREALLKRQLDLIACFDKTMRPSKYQSRSKLNGGQQSTLDRIASARAAISDVRHSSDEDITVLEMLAEGSFGKVYRGKWRGTDVAVKIIMLPGNMSGREKREKMIVWEAAISSSLIHPNVCQTYYYRIKPIKESAKMGLETKDFGSAVVFSDGSSSKPKSDFKGYSHGSGSEDVHSYEVQLVLEYCDQSSLRDALDAGIFMTPTGLNYAAQLDCAMDVAKAMLHLHCNNVLHLDLKTRNILLASSGAEGKGVVCKVSDFGLSVRMDHTATHVSSMFQGTITHMAPEVLLKGTCSKASDVYAFGIVMWELFTCGSPFRGVPAALLGHTILKDTKRPTWPLVVPSGYKDLASACWDQNPDARPSFNVILEKLQRLRKDLGTPTPPLPPIPVRQPGKKQPQSQEGRNSPLSFPAQEIVATRSADLVLEGQGVRLQPSTKGDSERSSTSKMVNGPKSKSLAPSLLSAHLAQRSASHSARLASPGRDPHAPGSNSHGSGISSTGSPRAGRPLRLTGPSRMKRSVKQGGTGEVLLVIGEEGKGPQLSSYHRKSLLLPPSELPSISEDDTLHRVSSTP